MNCEKCQELIHELLDGSIGRSDEFSLNTHLEQCLDCRTYRGEYEAPPNENALWLRIRNVIEAENSAPVAEVEKPRRSFLAGLLGRSWELSLPQLAASVSAIVLVVALVTVVGLRRWGNSNSPGPAPSTSFEASNVNDRFMQRQQVINYWNQRVELNKARWNPDMRETFERNLKVIDQAVNDSLNELHRNPHDEISEQMLNESLNDKLALLKEFSDL
jgi:hypothetical protein